MIERLTDLPEGAIGFRGSGRLTSQDHHDTLLPVIREALEISPGEYRKPDEYEAAKTWLSEAGG